MLIRDLIDETVGINLEHTQTIRQHCSQFLMESNDLPLMKMLPSTYPNFHKVKVRLQKRKDNISDVFEKAFGDQFVNLRQRAIFTYPSTPPLVESMDTFYIFPVNGYKYLYSKEVKNSNTNYQQLMNTMFEQMDSLTVAVDVITDLVKYTYVSNPLHEGIVSDSEIIVYSIPYYYAVRTTACRNYNSLLSIVK